MLWQPTRGVYTDAANILSRTSMPTDTVLRLANRSTGARITDFRWTGSLWLFSQADLTAVSTSRYGVIASVESTTSITLTAGHGLLTGDVVHIVDVSAGAELTTTYRTITVAGNVVTWTGAVASMAAGDLVFARGVSEIEIDYSTSGLAPWAGIGSALWASGLSVVCGAGSEGRVTAKALGLGDVSATGTTRCCVGRYSATTQPDASGDAVMLGWVSASDSTKSAAGGVGFSSDSRVARSNNGSIAYAGSAATLKTEGFVGCVADIIQAAATSIGRAMSGYGTSGVSGSTVDANHNNDVVLFDVRGSQSARFTSVSRC